MTTTLAHRSKSPDWIVIRSNEFVCLRCGEVHKLPLPMKAEVVAAQERAFARLHRACKAASPVKRFHYGQRMLVRVCQVGFTSVRLVPRALGTVVRLRICDDAAWIQLDERSSGDVHPFPADDPSGRGTHVLAFPDDCELVRAEVQT